MNTIFFSGTVCKKSRVNTFLVWGVEGGGVCMAWIILLPTFC